MIVKEHKDDSGRMILAICDGSLIGKKITENDLQLDLTSNFYNGEKKDEKEALGLMKKAYVLNIVGKKSISFALKNGFVDKKRIIYINKVPHTQTLNLNR